MLIPQIMTYKDLLFTPVVGTGHGTVLQAIVRFENNMGLSVLQGPGTLTSADRPYEAAVLSFSSDGTYSVVYPEFTHNDVLCYLTAEQVSEYMVLVSAETPIVAT